MIRSTSALIGIPLLSFAALLAACNIRMVPPSPSAWAITYPDTVPVTSGRVVRFAGSYGLGGPSPAVMFRQTGTSVGGQVLVWYPRFEPSDVRGRSPADSLAEWRRMEQSMAEGRQRMDSLYHCTAWSKGFQEQPAWVCRVPEQHGAVHWGTELKRLDSLVAARASAGPPGGRRYAPDTTRAGRTPPPPGPVKKGPVTGGVSGCMDGGSWSIEIRDSLGTRTTAPPPSSACPRPEGPGKRYEEGGWKMLRQFIAAVVQ